MPLGQILDLRVKPVVIAQRRLKDRLIMPMTPHMDIAGKLEHQRLRFAAAGTGTSNRWQIKLSLHNLKRSAGESSITSGSKAHRPCPLDADPLHRRVHGATPR